MNWIATRMLSTGKDSGVKDVEVSIGAPEQESADTWRCPFRVGFAGTGEIQYAYGIDGFQALMIAFSGIRAKIEELKLDVSWEGALAGDRGDHGFPQWVPQSFGLEFQKRIDELIDRELKEHVGALERTAGANARGAPGRGRPRRRRGERRG